MWNLSYHGASHFLQRRWFCSVQKQPTGSGHHTPSINKVFTWVNLLLQSRNGDYHSASRYVVNQTKHFSEIQSLLLSPLLTTSDHTWFTILQTLPFRFSSIRGILTQDADHLLMLLTITYRYYGRYLASTLNQLKLGNGSLECNMEKVEDT